MLENKKVLSFGIPNITFIAWKCGNFKQIWMVIISAQPLNMTNLATM